MLESFTGSEPHDHVLPPQTGRFSLALLIGLSIHAFLEGFPLAGSLHDHAGHDHGESYLLGVLLHKVPVIIVLSLMMIGSELGHRRASWLILLFALMTPAGLVVGEILPLKGYWPSYLLAFVVGSISHIAMHLIITRESGKGSIRLLLWKVLVMVMGFGLVLLTG